MRSAQTRRRYLERIGRAARRRPARMDLGCANLAHGFAACDSSAKDDLRGNVKPNVAIVSSYNDMLSAHQPYETFPARSRRRWPQPGRWRSSPVGCRPCVTGSRKGMPGWSYHCSAAT